MRVPLLVTQPRCCGRTRILMTARLCTPSVQVQDGDKRGQMVSVFSSSYVLLTPSRLYGEVISGLESKVTCVGESAESPHSRDPTTVATPCSAAQRYER
jgi:hypothetical protein